MIVLFLSWMRLLIAALVILVALVLMLGRGVPADVLAADANRRVLLVDMGRALVVDVSPARQQSLRIYTSPVWSPDGAELAVFEGFSNNIIIFNPYQRGVRRYLVAASYRTPLSWSPDSSHIAYVQSWSIGQDVAVLSLNTREAHPLTDDGTVIDLAWSPGGEQIVYRAQGQVMLADLAAETTQPLIDGDRYQAVMWSADGARVSLLSYGGTYDGSFSSEIIVVTPATGERDVFRCDDINPEMIAVWSPDWARIATQTSRRGLVVLDMAACAVRFAYPFGSNVAPVWLADDRLAFAHGNTLMVADVERGNVRKLTLPGNIGHIARQP